MVSDEEGPRWATLRPWLLQLGLPLLAGALLLGAVVWFGGWARDWLRRHEPANLPVADIDCPAPPGLTREEFLEEVRYVAGLSAEIDAHDEGSAALLAGAFRKHPWVRRVGQVHIQGGGASVDLVFREPVMFVKAWGRAVDAEGAILPLKANVKGLFVFNKAPGVGPVADESVRCAVSAAAFLHAHRARLGLEGAEARAADGQVEFVAPHCRVRWGRPPGKEQKNEPKAEEKLRRLLARAPLRGRGLDVSR